MDTAVFVLGKLVGLLIRPDIWLAAGLGLTVLALGRSWLRVAQWLQQGGGFADPVGQCRAIQIKAVALEDLALAVKWKMIGVFVDQDMGEKARTGTPAFDRAAWQRGLRG